MSLVCVKNQKSSTFGPGFCIAYAMVYNYLGILTGHEWKKKRPKTLALMISRL